MASASGPGHDPLDAIRQLVRGMQSLRDSQYTSAAAVTIWVYDIFLTFDLEGCLSRPFTKWTTLDEISPVLSFVGAIPMVGISSHDSQYIVSFESLYLFGLFPERYLWYDHFYKVLFAIVFVIFMVVHIAGFRGDLSESYCKKGTQTIAFILAHFCWTGIMLLRVNALWSQNRWLVRVLWVFWACTMGAIIATTWLSHVQYSAGLIYSPIVRMCVPTTAPPPVMAVSPVAPTFYELVMTILTIVKTYRHRALVGDSYISPLMSSAIAMANILCWNLLPSSHSLILLYLYWGLVATLMSRLVLNLRFTSRHRGFTGETTAGITYDSRFSFRPNRTSEVPATATTRINVDADDIDLQGLGHRVHDKRDVERDDVNDNQKSELAHTEGGNHRMSVLSRDSDLSSLPRDIKIASLDEDDEFQKGDVEDGNASPIRSLSTAQDATQIIVPLRTLSGSKASAPRSSSLVSLLGDFVGRPGSLNLWRLRLNPIRSPSYSLKSTFDGSAPEMRKFVSGKVLKGPGFQGRAVRYCWTTYRRIPSKYYACPSIRRRNFRGILKLAE
ncbi:hypothetical protein CPB86DRAFT_792953 [Serendipita vermifera]|nr:hypothetical protein CPB86DRAFT_792953 [Serendipita vermifera]